MAESDKRIALDGAELSQLFAFPKILRAVTMAFQPPRLALGLLMVVALMTVGRIWDGLSDSTVDPAALTAGQWTANQTGAAADATGIFQATASHVASSFNRLVEGLVLLRLADFFAAADDLFIRTPIALWQQDKIFTIVYGLIFVLVMAIGGGALSRMTAAEIARGEKLRLQEALDFALGAWRRLIFCLLLPPLIAGALCLLLVGGGWVLMLPWADVVGGLLYGIALVVGLGVAFLLIGYAAGFSLLVPAVACENCDAADAQQRAYAYVLSRPLHLLGYGVVGLVGLALGFVVVSVFAVAILNITGTLVEALSENSAVEGAGGFALFDLTTRSAPVEHLTQHSQWSAWFVSFWQTVVVCLVGGYVFAYYYGASTIIYLLLRRACDGQDITEIWQLGAVPGTLAPEPGVLDEAEAPADTAESCDDQTE